MGGGGQWPRCTWSPTLRVQSTQIQSIYGFCTRKLWFGVCISSLCTWTPRASLCCRVVLNPRDFLWAPSICHCLFSRDLKYGPLLCYQDSELGAMLRAIGATLNLKNVQEEVEHTLLLLNMSSIFQKRWAQSYGRLYEIALH